MEEKSNISRSEFFLLCSVQWKYLDLSHLIDHMFFILQYLVLLLTGCLKHSSLRFPRHCSHNFPPISSVYPYQVL